MFFQGSLQEGISTALQEAKLVVCFVTGAYFDPDYATTYSSSLSSPLTILAN